MVVMTELLVISVAKHTRVTTTRVANQTGRSPTNDNCRATTRDNPDICNLTTRNVLLNETYITFMSVIWRPTTKHYTDKE